MTKNVLYLVHSFTWKLDTFRKYWRGYSEIVVTTVLNSFHVNRNFKFSCFDKVYRIKESYPGSCKLRIIWIFFFVGEGDLVTFSFFPGPANFLGFNHFLVSPLFWRGVYFCSEIIFCSNEILICFNWLN